MCDGKRGEEDALKGFSGILQIYLIGGVSKNL